mgnify:CR=1 FL=1
MSSESGTAGKLIWESRTEKQAPRVLLFCFGGLFLFAAIAIGIEVIPAFSKPIRPEDELGRKIGVGLMLVCMSVGGFLLYQVIRPPKPPRGVIFFERGVEFGTPRRRRFIEYGKLQAFRFEPITIEQVNKENAVLIGRMVISAIAANPGGVGYAIRNLTAQKARALAVIQPMNERPFRVAVFQDGMVKLAAFVSSQKKPSS